MENIETGSKRWLEVQAKNGLTRLVIAIKLPALGDLATHIAFDLRSGKDREFVEALLAGRSEGDRQALLKGLGPQ